MEAAYIGTHTNIKSLLNSGPLLPNETIIIRASSKGQPVEVFFLYNFRDYVEPQVLKIPKQTEYQRQQNKLRQKYHGK